MKAEIKRVTPELATQLLSKNSNNRKVKKNTLTFYINQMKSGNWKENGEGIIIDTHGVIKDGQHRLMAIVESKQSYLMPIISGVSPFVMDTIDTGSNRSAADVLHLEGFKHSALLAGMTKIILSDRLTESGSKGLNISNNRILKFVENDKTNLLEICRNVYTINSLQVLKVLTPSVIGYFLYKYKNTENTIYFLKQITGTFRQPKTSTDYVFKKLSKSKTGEERLSLREKHLYIEKAYDNFLKGNKEINYLRINK